MRQRPWFPIVASIQAVAFNDTAANSEAVSSRIPFTVVRLVADAPCYVLFGADPTVTPETGFYLPANIVQEFRIEGGHEISVIEAATDGDGILSIMELEP